MKTATKSIKPSNNTYNPALDHLIGKELLKEKVDAARAFLKEHGLPKRFYEKGNS
jgi:protoheme ferro-lyase